VDEQVAIVDEEIVLDFFVEEVSEEEQIGTI
jgi:hypothetical protein